MELFDDLILAQNESRPPNLRKFMGPTINTVTLMSRAQKQISAERELH